jgi:hypothetical protein
LLIHLSNRYLDLNAEVQALAIELRKVALRIYSAAEPAQGTESADWAIVGGNSEILAALRPYGATPSPRRIQPWTDEHSSLFPLWK